MCDLMCVDERANYTVRIYLPFDLYITSRRSVSKANLTEFDPSPAREKDPSVGRTTKLFHGEPGESRQSLGIGGICEQDWRKCVR